MAIRCLPSDPRSRQIQQSLVLSLRDSVRLIRILWLALRSFLATSATAQDYLLQISE